MRRKRNVPAPSLLELQRERRETTELGYPGRCRRQPRKHTGPVPVHPWQRAWFMARDPGLRGETELRHQPGSTHLGAARPGPGFFLSFGSLKPGRWDLGPGLVGTQDSGLGDSFKSDLGFRTSTDSTPARAACTRAPNPVFAPNPVPFGHCEAPRFL